MPVNLDPESSVFLAAVNRIEARVAKANSQVSSGLKITVASDAPDQIGGLLQLRTDLAQNTQAQSNLTLANTDAQAADDALSSAIKMMDTALSLATQGATATMDAAGRQSIATQIQGIEEQMVACSQTTVQGRYIFSGDQDASPSYKYDSTQTNPVVQLIQPAATAKLADPAGGTFPAYLTAQQIFDDRDAAGNASDDNVFAALNSAITALQADDTAGISNTITQLKAASDHLNSMQSFYGNVEKRISNASDFASQYNVQLQTEISNVEDADVTSAVLDMTQAGTQLQAAFQMQAQMPHKSLFDYLG